jgi:tetratricopeptide (TPR) repeat protein
MADFIEYFDSLEKDERNLEDLKTYQEFLDFLVRILPGSTETLFYMAKARLFFGDINGAELRLTKCLNQNQLYLDAHLLLCEVYLEGKSYTSALNALELSLSLDFSIRSMIKFHYLKGMCHKFLGNHSESVKSFKEGLGLPASKKYTEGGECLIQSPIPI